jgi:catecholate siderophore receptor
MKKKLPSPPPARKRGRNRNFSVLSWALATTSVVGVQAVAAPMEQGAGQAAGSGAGAQAGAAQPVAISVNFNIPEGPLDTALAEFRRVTGLKVVLTEPRIGTVQSAGASGSLTPAKAMDALLVNTGIRATFNADEVRLELEGMRSTVSVYGEGQRLQSPKYTQTLLDTPQTVVVIPQQVFLEQNASTLRDVLRNTPGITMSIGEGGSGGTSSGDNVLIRGFSARNDIYIDGARDPGLVNRDAFNLESVEVAKGPSSVTSGRGTTGGSINLVTKEPELTDGLTVRVAGGSAGYKRAAVDYNHRLKDSMAFRMNGMWQDMGYPGRDVARYKSWGIAPSLALGLGRPTSVVLSYSRLDQDNIPDWGLPTLLPDTAIANGTTINDIRFGNFYGIASRDYEHTRSDHASVTLTHSLADKVTFRNYTRYGKNYRDAVMTPPRPATTVSGQGPEDPGYNPLVPQIRRTDTKYQHRNDQLFINQSDLSAVFKTGFIRHTIDAGLEISRDYQPTYAFTDLFSYGRPPVDDLFHPTPYVSYTPAYARTGAATDAHATTIAPYVFDTLKFSDKFSIDLGVRFDQVSADYTNTAATATGVPGVVTHYGRTDEAVTRRAGVIYKPVPKASVYAAFSTSFAPSFDGTLGLTIAATGVNSQTLAPEKTRNVEVGAKWDPMKNLGLTFALFDMEKTNAKTTDANGFTVLAGDQVVQGGEVGISGNITRRWGVFSGLSLMSGKVRASDLSYEVDQQLAYVPHTSMNFWTTYQLGTKLLVGGGVNFTSGHYFNQTGGYYYVNNRFDPRYVANAAAIQALSKYYIFNASATYSVNKHLSVQANGLNLNNAKYEDRGYDRHFLPGPTRQFMVGPVISW